MVAKSPIYYHYSFNHSFKVHLCQRLYYVDFLGNLVRTIKNEKWVKGESKVIKF